MKKTLQTKEILKLLGIAEATFKSWRQEGAPGKKRGRSLRINPRELYEWLMKTGREDAAAKLEKQCEDAPPPCADKKRGRPTSTMPPPKDSSSSSFSDLPEKGMNIFEARDFAGALLAQMKILMDNNDLAATAVGMKISTQLGDLLRKLELSCIEVDQHLGNVIRVSEVERHLGRMLARVKTDMRALPYSVADRLAGMTSPQEIAAFLSDKVDDALRHLAEKLKDE